MAKITFPDDFLGYTDGVRELESTAETFRDLCQQLRARWPALDEKLERSAVAIDGQIYQDAFLEPIPPDGEVFFMARIEGG